MFKTVLARSAIWKRIASLLIDLFIINSVLLIPFRKIFQKLPKSINFSQAYDYLSHSNELRKYLVMVTFFAALVAFLYLVLFETVMNQTIGKMLFNIYVIPAVKNEKELKEKGIKIGFFKACIRNLFIFPFFPFILLWLIEPISMFFSPINQRFTESITKTRTVERYLT